MPHNVHHEHLIKELTSMLSPIFKNSPQAVYLYLDDEHKTCNEKFAKLLGYSNIQAWVKNLYPVSDVDEPDQEKVIKGYMNASRKLLASSLNVTLVRKDGKKVKADLFMSPISYEGEVFVLHFLSPKK